MLLNVDLCFEDYNNTKMRSEVKNFRCLSLCLIDVSSPCPSSKLSPQHLSYYLSRDKPLDGTTLASNSLVRIIIESFSTDANLHALHNQTRHSIMLGVTWRHSRLGRLGTDIGSS